MIDRLIEIGLRNRLVVLMITFAVSVAGVLFFRRLPTDAFPDISPVMVPVFTEAHGMAPEEVERLITIPIESAMNGLPSVEQLKSTSAFGMTVVYVYFKDGVDIYFARQLVSERLQSVLEELPPLHDPPTLGPIATGLGEVFMYNLRISPGTDTDGKPPLTYLREINDWVVKYQLQAIPGITEILSMGGHVLQYQIELDPYALHEFDITLNDIVSAVNRNNRNAGGQFMVIGAEEYLVRGIGLIDALESLRHVRIKTVDGVPVTLRQIARVNYGNEIRRGVVTRNGDEEVVSGIIMKLIGENTSEVLKRLKAQLPVIQKSLPEGVTLDPYYNQGELVAKATGTINRALAQGAVLVLITLLIFLGNLRSAFIVALSLPVCALIAFVGMGLSGLSANLMSLGGVAIAIGMLADGSIVMVENIFRRLSEQRDSPAGKLSVIINAACEVGRPIVFSLSIVVIVFLPIFSLQGVEKKMFTPMALTMIFAIIGSMLVALFVAPAFTAYILKGSLQHEGSLMLVILKAYRWILGHTLKLKWVVTVMLIVLFGASVWSLSRLGTEFIPVLEEETLVVGVNLAPSSSLERNVRTIMRIEKMLLAFDEVEETVSKIGRPEAGGHPHPVNYALIQLKMKPRKNWKTYRSKTALVTAMEKKLKGYPGIQLNFTQPIQHLFDDLISGVKSQFALKLYGPDLEILEKKANEIRHAIDGIDGLADLSTEQSFGQPQLQIVADREKCARFGVDVADLLEIVELAIGGEVIDQVYVDNRRFGLFIRYLERYRNDPTHIEQLLVSTADNNRIPLGQVAQVVSKVGPLQINRERNQRRWTIQANIRGRDMGSVVKEIKERIELNVTLPPGYYPEYGGQFKNQKRAMARLSLIVPLSLLLILAMLYLTFHSIKNALLVMLSIPLSLIGGVFGLYITGEYLSVPAAIGFIALFGIAVQDSLVMVTCINQLRQKGVPVDRAVIEGAMLRVRPVLMTTLTTFLGLLPLLLSQGVGAEVQRPLAVVVVFGLISSTILTLLVKPLLYDWFESDAVEEIGRE